MDLINSFNIIVSKKKCFESETDAVILHSIFGIAERTELKEDIACGDSEVIGSSRPEPAVTARHLTSYLASSQRVLDLGSGDSHFH